MRHRMDPPPLEFAVPGDPKPYRRALSDGRGGRRRHPDADHWKFLVRGACARAIILAVTRAPELAHRLGLERVAAIGALKLSNVARPLWGPQEPWFPLRLALAFTATVWVLRPKSHFLKSGQLRKGAPEFPIAPPDAGNYGKELEDAIAAWPARRQKQAGGRPLAYHSDAQIISSKTTKLYADGISPGAHVRVARFDFDDSRLDK